MDVNNESFLDLWKILNQNKVQYILVGGFAANFHGYQRYTGDVDIFLKDDLENRKKLRQAYKAYCNIDFESFETIQFVPGWVDFPLNNGIRLDIMTNMVGIDASFDECLEVAKIVEINGIEIPVLNINHLISNKKAVGREKDKLDVSYLEKIKKLGEQKE